MAGYLFDPDEGETILEPEASGLGSWVGAPSAYRKDGLTYLSYRRRRPRGSGRGYATFLAVSEDRSPFRELWCVSKETLYTSSIERCAIVEGGEGFILYVSYVDPNDHRWCIDACTTPSAADLGDAVATRKPVLRAVPLGLDAVKDPVVVRAGGLYWMYVSCATRALGAEEASTERLHASDDVYTTGLINSETGLAVSRDGLQFEWLGTVLRVNEGHWDAYAARVSAVATLAGLRLAFYDGSARVEQNYEEQTGVALMVAPTELRRLSVGDPWLVSANGSGSLRYMSTVRTPEGFEFYYEWARKDGSHETRRSALDLKQIAIEGVLAHE